ncbi:MAG: polysaccharide biosynthesis protein [Candidatus Puniceispirillaceae bacterium]
MALPRNVKRLSVMATDSLLAVISVWLAFYLQSGSFLTFWTVSHAFAPVKAWLIAIMISIPVFIYFGLYRVVFRYAGGSAMMSITKAVGAYGVLYALVVAIIGLEGVPGTIGIIQPIVFFLLVAASRGISRLWLGGMYKEELTKNRRPKALIYGAGAAGRELAAALAHSREVSIVGFLDDNHQLQGSQISGHLIYAPEQIGVLAEKLGIAQVMVAMPSVSLQRRKEIIEMLVGYPFTVQTLPSYSDLSLGRVTVNDIREVSIEDILGRDSVAPDEELMASDIAGKTVMVTGAGGSIGSELASQILKLNALKIILFDHSEFALFQIRERLEKQRHPYHRGTKIISLLGSVTDKARLSQILTEYSPDTIYHAAAYKHVPIVEDNPFEGIYNNCFGTLVTAEQAIKAGVKKFVLISTDKAVRPTNIMGASKRLAEIALQALSTKQNKTIFAMVRFGNVLNSSGSVVPIFKEQIKAGGPVTVTHKDVTRYFMTISEAASLVIQAGAMTTTSPHKGQAAPVYLLDMGEPVKIYELAVKMIELSGLRPMHSDDEDGDIKIAVTGLRVGEKLYEELLISEDDEDTAHPKIRRANETHMSWREFSEAAKQLDQLAKSSDNIAIISLLEKLVTGFKHQKNEKN